MNVNELAQKIDWQKVDGLIPAIVQDDSSLDVLMLAYMNAESLHKTFEDKKITFFSRTKQKLWQKGETSGNSLEFVSAKLDCDNDTLLLRAKPLGPSCHTGSETCFGERTSRNISFLYKLEQVIQSRKMNPDESSYTSELFKKGINKIAQKLGEEGVETVIAGLSENDESLISESADLIYHLLVLLASRDIELDQVIAKLASRQR